MIRTRYISCGLPVRAAPIELRAVQQFPDRSYNRGYFQVDRAAVLWITGHMCKNGTCPTKAVNRSLPGQTSQVPTSTCACESLDVVSSVVFSS
jgi:hypothetical protein